MTLKILAVLSLGRCVAVSLTSRPSPSTHSTGNHWKYTSYYGIFPRSRILQKNWAVENAADLSAEIRCRIAGHEGGRNLGPASRIGVCFSFRSI